MKQSTKSVFDVYAHEYDLITNAKAREQYHRKEVRALVDEFNPTAVLDAGCATGLTASLFARAGIRTIGLDHSKSMLKVARQKFGDSGWPLSFRRGEFEALPGTLAGKFDLVVCLANSISGVQTMIGLAKSMRSFYTALQPGGHLVLQALNYNSLEDGAVMPIRVTRNNGIVYQRFSRRRGMELEVFVIRLDLNAKPPHFEPFCHTFENYTVAALSSAMRTAGFANLRKFDSLYLDTKFSPSARDIVLTARRPAK